MPKYIARAQSVTWLAVHSNDAPRWCGFGQEGPIQISHYLLRSHEETRQKNALNRNGFYHVSLEKDNYYNEVEDKGILEWTRPLHLNEYVQEYGGYL